MEITPNTIDERQISFKGWSLYDHTPETNDIITVVYASFDDIFMFDVTGMTEEEKDKLVHLLIVRMQSGTNVSRDVKKKTGNIYFVY